MLISMGCYWPKSTSQKMGNSGFGFLTSKLNNWHSTYRIYKRNIDSKLYALGFANNASKAKSQQAS
jgi:hypothetical protein